MSIESYVASLPIPGDSPSISGVYLEQIIPGYRTEKTEGRWNLSSELDETSRSSDWTKFKNKKYSPKEFTVHYYITCDTPQNLHAASRKLRGFLHQNRKEFKLIFRDEENIFYNGIVSNISGEKLVNICSISGEFVIHCADGRGYSTQEYEIDATLAGDTTYFNVEYEGTSEAYPVLEANVKSETGFIGFLTEDGKIIQIGDPTAQKDVGNSLINHSFKDNTVTNWARNTYTPKQVEDRTFSPAGTTKASGTGMGINSAGSGTNNHGPVYLYDLGGDAQNFQATMEYVFNMNTGVVNSQGGIDLILIGKDDGSSTEYEVARLSIYKKDNKTSAARIELIVDGKVVEYKDFKMDDPASNIYTGQAINISK